MGLTSRLLWTAAITLGIIAAPISIADGRTPVTEQLFLWSLGLGLLGGLVGLARRFPRLAAFLRRHWLWVGFGVILTGLALTIAAQVGVVALVVIGGAGVGAFLVLGAIFLLSGKSVAHHAVVYREQLPGVARQIRAIEAGQRTEARR